MNVLENVDSSVWCAVMRFIVAAVEPVVRWTQLIVENLQNVEIVIFWEEPAL